MLSKETVPVGRLSRLRPWRMVTVCDVFLCSHDVRRRLKCQTGHVLFEVKQMQRTKEKERLEVFIHVEEYRALARAMLHP
jgi:hypothetical protein